MSERRKVPIRKLIFFAVSMLIGGGLGFFAGMIGLSQLGLPEQYRAIPWYGNLSIFILTYFFSVGIHEIGHFISFKRNGVQMRALFITIFLFIHEEDGWKFRIRPNNITFMGGIAVPDLVPVGNAEDFTRLKNVYSQAILAGPIASVLFCGAGLALSIPFMLLADNAHIQSFLATFAVSLFVITVFILATSLLKNDLVIGDFPAYRICRTDEFFVAMQLYQYAAFSSDPVRRRQENQYLKGIIVKGLEEKLENGDIGSFTLNIVDALLVEYLAGVTEELPDVVSRYIEFMRNAPEARKNIAKSEISIMLWFHMVRFLGLHEETRPKAVEYCKMLEFLLKRRTPVTNYLMKQTKHALGLADHSEFLRDKKNIRVSSAHGLWRNFEGYFIDEMKLNGLK